MKIPKYIEFHNETNYVLSSFLKEAEPAEGCAILIGQKKTSKKDKSKNFWEVKFIWNCRNIWGEPESKLINQNKGEIAAIKMEVSRNTGPKDNFLQNVRDLASENNIVLIFLLFLTEKEKKISLKIKNPL